MNNQEKSMSILDHFEELRMRLLKALIALAVFTFASFYLGEYFLELLVQPIGGLDKVQSIEVTENIGVFMRVSLLSGFILSFPFIFYQILSFILPGLKPKEKKWIFISIPFATIMFVIGVAFAYFIMLPAAIPFLVSFLGINTTPRLSNYINFVTNLLFWIGVSFELPLLIFILAKIKLVSANMLLKQWRIAIVIIAVLAAFITPTVDPVNMALLMLPLLTLYFLSVLLALFANRPSKEQGNS